MDISLLRESFDSQLRVVLVNKEVIYMELFEADETRKEELFEEYCKLEPEPDKDAYLKDRLRKDNLSDEEWDAEFVQRNDTKIRSIFEEFVLGITKGEILPEHYRPQLDKTVTFKKFKEIDNWQKDLINSLIEKDRDKIEMPVFISRILRLLGELNNSNSHRIAQKIHDDDLSNKITDNVIFNSWIDERFGSDKQIPMVDLGFSPNDQTPHPEKPEVKQKDQILRDWRHVRAILQDRLKPYLPVTKVDQESYSVPVWVLVFYYAESAKSLPDERCRSDRMKSFITSNGITTTFNSFRNNFYRIRKRINEESNYPVHKIEKVLPLLEGYSNAKNLAQNDIEFLRAEKREVEE